MKRILIDLDEETTIKTLTKLAVMENMKLKPFIEKLLTEYAAENDIEFVRKPVKNPKKK